MAQAIEITRDAFIAQADGALVRLRGEAGRDELTGIWQRLVGNADTATVFLRTFDASHDCWHGALTEDDFYSEFLPVSDKIVSCVTRHLL